MRLIDAERLRQTLKDIKTTKKHGFSEEQEKWINFDIDLFMGLISEEPTAYDVDKVVNQINKKSMKMSTTKPPHVYMRAIGTKEAEKIVKEGGIDV